MDTSKARAVYVRLAPHPPHTPEHTQSRAGRNLKRAVPTALLLLALVAVSVIVKIEIFVLLVGIALTIGLWEVAGAFLARHIRIPIVALWIGTWLMVGATWKLGMGAAFVVFLLTAAAAFSARVIDGEHRSPADALAGIFALAWISLLGSFAVAIAHLPDAPWMIALLVLMPVANDTGGWAAGVLWGRHPMSPSISPKKSWEGFAGSVVLATAVSVALVTVGLNRPWYVAVVVALASVACSTIGDLSESLLKRDLGVKDMGSIFPGHGGMLDRIDSILMWAPFCYVMLVG